MSATKASMKLISLVGFTIFFLFSKISLSQWRQTGYGVINGHFTSISIQDSQVIAGSINGVYLSNDWGLNWIQRNEGLPDLMINSLATSQNVWAVATPSGIYITENSGQSWILVGLSDKFIQSIIIVDNFLICAGNGIFRSNDNGLTWQPILEETGLNIKEIIDAGSYLLAINGLGSILKSIDNGNTWNEVATWSSQIYSISADGDIVYATTSQGIKKSVNGGESWYDYSSYNWFTKISIKEGVVLAGGFGGIYREDQEFGFWTPANISSTFGEISAFSISPSRFFISTTRGGILYSEDSGLHWEARNKGLVSSRVNSIITNGTTFYASNANEILKTENDGLTWEIIFTLPDQDYQLSDLFFLGNTLFATAGTHGIYRSLDGGLTWQSNTEWPASLRVNSITDQGTTLFVGTNSGLYKSTDNGNTWLQSGFSGEEIIEVYATESSLFVMGSMGNYRSSTSGSTFQPFSNFAYSTTSHRQMIEFNQTLYLATDFGLYYSQDDGTSWTLFEELGFGLIDNVAVSATDLFASTMGEIYMLSDKSIQKITPSLPLTYGDLFDGIVAAQNQLMIGINSTSSIYGSIWTLPTDGLPKIVDITPNQGKVESYVTIKGINFNIDPLQNEVSINGIITPVQSASQDQLIVQIPYTYGEATLQVKVDKMETKSIKKFKILPQLVSINPIEGVAGTYVTLEGSGLNVVDVLFNESYAATYFKSNNKILAVVPVNATTGPIKLVMEDSILTSISNFQVIPVITSFSPSTGKPGDEVTIIGTGLVSSIGEAKVIFNGSVEQVISGNSTIIKTNVPEDAKSGSISVEVSGRMVESNSPFLVLPLPVLCTELASPTIEETQGYLVSSYDDGNRWFLNGELIPNETSKKLKISESGMYQVQAWIDDCPSPLSTPYAAIITSTTISESFKIFPTPAKDWIKIQLPVELWDQSLVIHVYDILGKESLHPILYSNNQIEMEINNLSSGVYIIEIIHGSQMYRSKFLIE